MTAHPFHALKLAGIALAALLLAACGAKDDDKKAATQAAARVNGAEITVHQINQILGRLPGISEETAPKARQEVLGKLIDQQLAVEQAIDKKLDRQPEVMAALEAARREVLARVYLEQAAAAKGRPTPEEGKKYYDEHPELFAQRRIYNLREVTVEKNEELMPALREKLASAKSMDEVAAWLKQKEARFSAQGGVRPAEQIPLDLLGSLHKMKDGQTTVFDTSRGIVIVQVAATQQAPVDEKNRHAAHHAVPRQPAQQGSRRCRGEAAAREGEDRIPGRLRGRCAGRRRSARRPASAEFRGRQRRQGHRRP